jgi:hypothetical protein
VVGEREPFPRPHAEQAAGGLEVDRHGDGLSGFREEPTTRGRFPDERTRGAAALPLEHEVAADGEGRRQERPAGDAPADVLVASALVPFLPLPPLQILTTNLLDDGAQIPIPTDRDRIPFLGSLASPARAADGDW